MEPFNFENYFRIMQDRITSRQKARMLPLDDDMKRSLCNTLGFYCCSLDGKKKYYIHLESGKLGLVNYKNINNKIHDYIGCYFKKSLDPINKIYLEALYSSNPSMIFKRSDLIKCCSEYSLNDDTKHQLRMLIDDKYRKLYNRDEVIKYLSNNSFKYNEYKFESACHTDGFYYKQINENDYLICSYAAYDKKRNIYIFDMFRCYYSNFREGGTNDPTCEPEDLILGVNVSKHKKGLDYLMANPYASKYDIYSKIENI